MKKNQIILIIVGVLILVGLVFYFNYWLKQIQPKTGTSVPTEEKTEISQEEAIEIAQEKHPGEVYKVKAKGPDGVMEEKELPMLDVVMDASTLQSVGTMVGSAGVMVLDDSRDMVWALNNLNQFYAHESCGQCTPCREGSLWMAKMTTRMLDGDAKASDSANLKSVADNIAGRTICAFGEACSWPTQSFLQKFPEEFEAAAAK